MNFNKILMNFLIKTLKKGLVILGEGMFSIVIKINDYT